jgi:hypothetical protein
MIVFLFFAPSTAPFEPVSTAAELTSTLGAAIAEAAAFIAALPRFIFLRRAPFFRVPELANIR